MLKMGSEDGLRMSLPGSQDARSGFLGVWRCLDGLKIVHCSVEGE